MQGEKLKNAMKWFDMAVKYDQENKPEMMNRCLNKAIQFESEGLAAGESWD